MYVYLVNLIKFSMMSLCLTAAPTAVLAKTKADIVSVQSQSLSLQRLDKIEMRLQKGFDPGICFASK